MLHIQQLQFVLNLREIEVCLHSPALRAYEISRRTRIDLVFGNCA